MIRALLEKGFDIREGELFRAASMQLNIFLIITTLLILKPTVNSLFLSTYGIETLPNAYIFVAIIAGLVTTAYSKIVQHVRFFYLNIATLISSVLILLFFGMALRIGLWDRLILYIFYIWVSIFAVLTTSQFWLLANQVFNVREIKRLVGFIGSGAIAGGIFGGYLISFLILYMSSEDLSFVAAFTIALCIPLTILISVKRKRSIKKELPNKVSTKKSKEHPLKLILQSRHLLLLACLVAVSNIVAKLVDYQFSDMASSTIPDKEELTAFFGFWFSTFNVAALMIQLLATRYILNSFGVGSSLLILPVAIMLTAACLIFAPELLMAVIAMKMVDGSFKQSVNKSAMELLVLPINSEIKNQTKTFIDVFVDSLAAGFSGLLLIFVVKGLSLSSISISILILGFTGLWIFLVTKVKKEYLFSFKMKIINDVGFDRKTILPSYRQKSIDSDVNQILRSGKPNQILPTLRQIKSFKNKKYLNSVYDLLKNKSSEVRVEAIQYLSHFKDKKAYALISPMTEDLNTKVAMAAFVYLVEHTPFKGKAIIDKHLESRNHKLRGLALISLAAGIQNNPKLKRKYRLKERILNKANALQNITDPKLKYFEKIYCVQAIGQANIPDLYPLLKKFMNDEKAVVARQAILAAGRTRSEFFVKDLIRFSNNKQFSRMAIKALRLYENDLLPILRSYLTSESSNLKLIRSIPRLLKNRGKQKSVLLLFKLLEHKDMMVRQKSLEALSSLHRNFPKLSFKKKKINIKLYDEILRMQDSLALLHFQTMQSRKDVNAANSIRKRVIELLNRQLQRQLDNILFLLTLRYSPDNIAVIKKGLKSKKVRMRITALEFLDNLIDSRLKRLLIPLFEVAVVDKKKRSNIDQLKLKIPTSYDCFETILTGNDSIRLKIATLELIRELQNPFYFPLVKNCMDSGDPELKLMAKHVMVDLSENRAMHKKLNP